MFLNLLAVFAEYERELIRERCMAGQKAARLRGQVWGRKPKLTDSEAKKITAMWRSGWYEQSTLADMFDMSTASVRDYIHKVERRGRWKNATTPTQ
jgi:DNA invertase Pin-like site-specific DNA recombinase